MRPKRSSRFRVLPELDLACPSGGPPYSGRVQGEEDERMLTTQSTGNAYDVALENFDTAADAMELDANTREMIKYPERALTVSIPVRMDDGHIHRFQGYRVQHSTARG